MKKALFTLFSAGALAWGLTGCATASGGKPAATHTLKTDRPVFVDLPSAFDGFVSELQTRTTVVRSVKGLNRVEVLQALGQPTQRVNSNLWIYWRYYSPEETARSAGYDTLLVAFAHGEVSEMKLVKGADLQKRLGSRAPRQI